MSGNEDCPNSRLRQQLQTDTAGVCRWVVLALGVGTAAAAGAEELPPPPVGVAPQTSTAEATAGGDVAARLVERLMQRYDNGDYDGVASDGLAALDRIPENLDFRLAVANSLAWTGKLKPAIEQYERLLGTRLDQEARVGIASIQSWRGRPHLSKPMFEQVLKENPDNKEAQEGLGNVRRQLAPRSTLGLGAFNDSERIRRRGSAFAHAWWNEEASQRYELGGNVERISQDELSLPNNDFGFGVWWARAPLAPRLDVSYQTEPYGSVFLQGQVELVEDWLSVRAGRVNWGRHSISPKALRDQLVAGRLGITGTPELAVGQLEYAVDAYRVSDDNEIVETSLRLAPVWQPLGKAAQWYVGTATRKADRSDARYWSPVDGYGVAYVGLTLTAGNDANSVYAYLQPSVGLWGESKGGSIWSGGLGARAQVTRDLSLGVEGSANSSRRDDSSYRSRTLGVRLESTW
ncbi:MAG: hypothetical protein HY778_14920 [Betaproteobacteria bacterium]|nr:hypothetical protein [Betaproteobacteria bacterium]